MIRPHRPPSAPLLAGLLLAGLLLVPKACTRVTAGWVMAGEPTATESAATVPPSALGDLLLSPGDIDMAVDATDMKVWKSFDTAVGAALTDRDCLALDFPAIGDVYAGSGWKSIRGQQLIDTDAPAADRPDRLAVQAVIGFGSAEAARTFFNDSRRAWRRCAGRSLSDPKGNQPDLSWIVGEFSEADGVITASKRQSAGPLWNCHRALTVVSNVVVDVQTCSGDVVDPSAGLIAERIARKIRGR